MPDDLDELHAFLALADHGSFAAAARHLARDPTIVSRRVQALETRLGVRLAERNTRRVVLTEAGRAYAARLRPLLAGLRDARTEVAEFAGAAPRGHLRVTLPGSFGRLWLMPAIVAFLAAHPRIAIDLQTDNEFVDIVAARFDVAIRLGVLPDSRLVARKVASRRRLICAAPAYLARTPPLATPTDLAAHACLQVGARAGKAGWRFREAGGGETEIAVDGPIVANDAEFLVAAARAGLGVLNTSDWYVGRDLARGDLVEVLHDWPVVDEGGVYLVTPAGPRMPGKTRAFSDWIARALAKPPWLTP